MKIINQAISKMTDKKLFLTSTKATAIIQFVLTELVSKGVFAKKDMEVLTRSLLALCLFSKHQFDPNREKFVDWVRRYCQYLQDPDYRLLIAHPQALLAKVAYQKKIRINAKILCKNGFFQADSLEDVIQEVNQVCIEKKLTYIQKSFDPGFQINKKTGLQIKLINFFELVVFRTCQTILEKRKVKYQRLPVIPVEDYESFLCIHNDSPEYNLMKNEAIRNEVIKLNTCINFDKLHKEKTLLLMKLYYRVNIQESDIRKYHPTVNKEMIRRVMFYFKNKNYSDTNLYKYITPLINEKEGTNVKSDSIRKWFDRKTNTYIIPTLNSNTEINYDLVLLGYLFELMIEYLPTISD